MPLIGRSSFAKGEVSPAIYGRVDTKMYKIALRTARNAIIHTYGGVSNRPGLVCVAPFKFHTEALFPAIHRFHQGTSDQYVLEVGDLYMRFVRNDKLVRNADVTITGATQANPVVVTAAAHGYSNGADVTIDMDAGMIELNGRRFIVRNVATNTFELEDLVSGDPVDGTSYTAYTTGGVVASIYEIVTPYAQADLATLKFVQTGNTITITGLNYAPRDLTRTDHDDWTLSVNTYAPTLAAPTNGTISSTADGNFKILTNGGLNVNYRITAISDTDGSFEESLPLTITGNDGSDPPLNTLGWDIVTDADRYAVYRRDNGLYGLLGETELLSFEDKNLGTDLTISPPSARNPFSSVFPMASGYYQQRQAYGGTSAEPDKTWYSQTGLRLNMSVSSPLQPSDAITASLSSQDVQEIRHYVPVGGDLMVMTNAAEWRVNSGPDSGFSADTIKQQPETNWGSSHDVPIVVGKTILFVEDGGARVRALGFQFAIDGFDTNDLTILASHLLADKGPDEHIIADWSFGQFPEPRVYVVRSDGKALTMTFDQEQEVVAWTTWDTRGQFKKTTSLRRSVNGVEDGIYFGVRRRGADGHNGNYLERLHSRKFSDVRNAFFLDHSVELNNKIAVADISNAVITTEETHGLVDGDEIEITEIDWANDIADECGDDTPNQFNDLRFTVANATALTFELLERSFVEGGDWDLSTATKDTCSGLFNQLSGPPHALAYNSTGTKLFALDTDSDTIFEFGLDAAYDIGTLQESTISYDYSAITSDARGMSFSEDGTQLLLAGISSAGAATIYELTLSTGFLISSASDSGNSTSIAAQTNQMFGIDTNSTGSLLYVATMESGGWVLQFDMSSAWDASTITYAGVTLDASDRVTNLRSVYMRGNGTQILLLDYDGTNSFVHEYTLAVVDDIDTETYKSTTDFGEINAYALVMGES